MKKNKTSETVELFLDCTEDGLGSLPPESFQAIREKYKRMEEALDKLVFLHCCEQEALSPPSFDEWLKATINAEDALAFDPLTP